MIFRMKVMNRRIMEHNSMKTTILILYVLVFAIDLLEASDLPCSTPKSTGVKVLLNSQRNRTGHWLTQVDLEQVDSHGSSLEAKDTGRFSVAVQHIQTSASCKSAATMVIRTTITVPPGAPGPDYELFPNIGYYKLHTHVSTWERAREICAQEGTHLAIINSSEEADIIMQLFARYSKFDNASHNDYAYIGFHDLTDEGQFVTIFGDPLTKVGYLQWHGDEPNLSATNNEDCGLIHRDGKLADVVCHWNSPFVCEQEL